MANKSKHDEGGFTHLFLKTRFDRQTSGVKELFGRKESSTLEMTSTEGPYANAPSRINFNSELLDNLLTNTFS